MDQENKNIKPNPVTGNEPPNAENTQARTDDNIREGQEDSSLHYDKEDPKGDLPKINEDDKQRDNQQEYLSDQNTLKSDNDYKEDIHEE